MLKAVFFDLDGTLLPMNEEEFTNEYFKNLYLKVKDRGYDQQELIKVIWAGTKLMYKNDGSKTNEEVFWDYFKSVYGNINDKPIFDDFYVNEFKKTKAVCKENPLARAIVEFVKNNGLLCILSTNPIFPKEGTLTRMNFINLSLSDFDLVTTYEDCRYSKPNPKYFTELLNQFSLKPEEVILFGNNDLEDYVCSQKAGIECILVGENLILHPELGVNPRVISMDEVINVIKEKIDERNKD